MNWTIEKRPKQMKELYGLEAIKKYFYAKNAEKDWPKAILLRGQFGSGKSTIANIWAAALVCQHPDEQGEPCGQCPSCKAVFDERFDRDVIRIDGGQSGKAEIIDLINEHIATPPMYDSKKVIIMEEIGELSSAARNSLLKILEHPRDRIHFILVSMETGFISGFSSRCVTFNFKKLPTKDIMFFLKKTMEDSGVWKDPSIPDEFRLRGLMTIAQVSVGSIRQALQVLQACLDGKFFTAQEILDNLGYADEANTIEVLLKLLNRDDSVWGDLIKYEAGEFFAIAYKVISDAAMYKVSEYLADEGNPWIVDNTKMLAAHPNFSKLQTTINTLAPISKPYLRKSELLSYLTILYEGLSNLQKMQETPKRPASESIPVRQVRS